MQTNIGNIDRALRLMVGAGLLAWALAFGGPLWAFFGIIPLSTAILKWCPLYSLINIKTSK